jgi:hypothetical protein
MMQISELQKPANDKFDLIAETFINQEVISAIEVSTTFPKILKSKDPEEFMDIPLIQWDTCTANILCILLKEFRAKKIAASQSLLIRICKLSARKIYAKHNLMKN